MSRCRPSIAVLPEAVVAAGFALALLASGCGSTTRTVSVNGPPAGVRPVTTVGGTSSTGSAAAPSATRIVQETMFRSPTGNIGCSLLGGLARCDIAKRSWPPPARPASCPTIVDFGQGLEVGSAGEGRFVCAGDTVRDPASPRLAYGTATRIGGLECLSARDGVTCTARTSRHGFFISLQRYRIF